MYTLRLILNLSILSSVYQSWQCWSLASTSDELSSSRAEPDRPDTCLSRQWDSQQREMYCAVEGETDKYLEWIWIPTSPRKRTNPIHDGQPEAHQDTRSLLEGSIRLTLAPSASLFTLSSPIERHADLQLTQKAKIYLPFWKPTMNEGCEFSYNYRVVVDDNSLTSRRQKEPTSPNYRWPQLSVVLVVPSSTSQGGGSSWPTSSDKLQLDKESLAEVRLLDTFNQPTSRLGTPVTNVVRVGKQMAGTWSLALLVETRLDANLFELAGMKLTNCSERLDGQKNSNNNNIKPIDLEKLFEQTCKNTSDEFQCRLSGRCISLDYRCDFGRDCGENDDSDEFRCPADFEGRCNFEDPGLCHWIPAPRGQSWLWTPSVSSKQESSYKPPVDHTYQSRSTTGHYMLLSSNQLDSYRSAQLLGPRVQLKANHKECKFRFWAQTPAKLGGASMKSTHLTIGYSRVGADELFGGRATSSSTTTMIEPVTHQRQQPGHIARHDDENGWHRFQVTLFDREVLTHGARSIFALNITFGNLLKDLELFASSDGYLALDDFSFSPGCSITYNQSRPAPVCGDTEFRCDYASPSTPGTFCIPFNRVCDFKEDCGVAPSLPTKLATITNTSNLPASDELVCIKRFDINQPDDTYYRFANTGIQVTNYAGSKVVGHTGAVASGADDATVNQAFTLVCPGANETETVTTTEINAAKLQPYIIRAQYKSFRDRLNGTSIMQWYAKDIGLLLPRFHQAHANCKLTLDVGWSSDSKNLVASIYLIRSGTSTLYKRWWSDVLIDERSDQRRITWSHTLGIGEQNSQFNVYLELSFESINGVSQGGGNQSFRLDVGDSLTEFSGEFNLFRYNFEDCNHQPGIVVSRPNQANVIAQTRGYSSGDSNEDEDKSDEDKHALTSSQTAPMTPLPTCQAGQFQCGTPILCIDERLVCDMQRDCQESGWDELDCASRGYIQYDFESSLNELELANQGWLQYPSVNEDSICTGLTRWSIGQANQELRARYDLGPPVDHTTGLSIRGNFLTLTDPKWAHNMVVLDNEKVRKIVESETHGIGQRVNETTVDAWIYTPKMKVLDSCKRLVLYLYSWIPEDRSSMAVSLHRNETVSYGISAVYFRLDGQAHSKLLWKSDTKMNKMDWWHRVELELPHAQLSANCPACQGAIEFLIGFHGTVSTTVHTTHIHPPITLAIDDVSLGPKCQPVSGVPVSPLLNTTKGLDGGLVSTFRGGHRMLVTFGWLFVLVVFAGLSALMVVYNKKMWRPRLGDKLSSGQRLVSLDSADNDYALDDLCDRYTTVKGQAI